MPLLLTHTVYFTTPREVMPNQWLTNNSPTPLMLLSVALKQLLVFGFLTWKFWRHKDHVYCQMDPSLVCQSLRRLPKNNHSPYWANPRNFVDACVASHLFFIFKCGSWIKMFVDHCPRVFNIRSCVPLSLPHSLGPLSPTLQRIRFVKVTSS